MKLDKKKLRKKFLNSRDMIRNRFSKEKKIKNNLQSLLNANTMLTSVYYPVRSEVNLESFVRLMQKNNHRFALPIIHEKGSHLLFKEWRMNEELKIDKYNIKVPVNNIFVEPKILIVPILAFDKNKNRLGYGGGYYDRTILFLEKKYKILKLGVAFDEQQANIVPVKNYDKKMDVIITQSRILT